MKISNEVFELLGALWEVKLEEDSLDDFYGESVRAGCDCGCGGDTMMDSWSDLMEDREEILSKLRDLGVEVDFENQ